MFHRYFVCAIVCKTLWRQTKPCCHNAFFIHLDFTLELTHSSHRLERTYIHMPLFFQIWQAMGTSYEFLSHIWAQWRESCLFTQLLQKGCFLVMLTYIYVTSVLTDTRIYCVHKHSSHHFTMRCGSFFLFFLFSPKSQLLIFSGIFPVYSGQMPLKKKTNLPL